MNMIQKAILTWASIVVGVIVSIVGLFTNGTVLTVGLILLLGGIAYAVTKALRFAKSPKDSVESLTENLGDLFDD